MKKLFLAGALILATLAPATAAVGKYLNVALLSLPPRYLADIPLDKRDRLLTLLSMDMGKHPRLDYAGGWLHWSYDGPPQNSPGGSSMFWVKLLPLGKNSAPLVFVHMSKPFADGKNKPANDQTFILRYANGEWKDVTAETMPAGIDLTMHFRPRRSDLVIEAASYEEIKRQDGRGSAYDFGKRELDLIWEDGAFRVGPPLGKEFTRDWE